MELSTLAFTEIRVGELQGLARDRVDLATGWIDIAEQLDGPAKTETSKRTIPIHPRLLRLLKSIDDNGQHLLFTAEGRQIDAVYRIDASAHYLVARTLPVSWGAVGLAGLTPAPHELSLGQLGPSFSAR
jgi:integrase